MSAEERARLRSYLRGNPVKAEVGWWPLILEAAGHDPLRAQELEDGLTQEWWERWLTWHESQARVSQEQQREARRKAKRR